MLKYKFISFKILLTVGVISLVTLSCKNKSPATEDLSMSPDNGTSYKLGESIPVRVLLPKQMKADSIVYLVDSVKKLTQNGTQTASLKTDTLTLGSKLITARVFFDGKQADISTSITLKSAIIPEKLTYKVEKVFKHDTASYTEGLEYHDGYLYESTGEADHSYLQKVELETGKIVKSVKLDKKYFGEGITIVGDKIIQLTYRENEGFVYDKNTFKKISSFTYNWGREGWALCFDGIKILNDDSSNRIWFLNKNTYMPQGYLDVYDDKRGIDSLNELEYIDHKIYSNVYTHDTIVVINPKNGSVLQRIDMKNLYPLKDRPAGFNNNENVLNGIAWDQKGKRLFVTGKKWPHLYQIKLIKQ
ncbi:MAG: glutaminyl-peptide cyclotransferase [Sphingobacteriaceae bacterium]|nr:MAG: glutaminyl-peptide cyclotransferase [Sphingobacteriaceae bacterium]